MKITKRQLKRIIREEYTRLQRRGLIRENYEEEEIISPESDEYIDFVDLYHTMRDHGNAFWDMWQSKCEENGWSTDPYHWDDLVDLAHEEGEVDEYFSAASQR